MSNVVEVKARGADVLALATESHRGEMAKTVENVITIPDTAQMLLPSLGVCRCSCWRIISRSSAGVILISLAILRNLSLLNKKGAPERVLLFCARRAHSIIPHTVWGTRERGILSFGVVPCKCSRKIPKNLLN